MNQEHKYISFIQCDDPNCYAGATQNHNCKRLDELDELHIEEKKESK